MSNNHPTKADSPSAILDQAIEFTLNQRRQGKSATVEELVRQFPTIEEELREIYSALMLADQLRVDSGETSMPQSPSSSNGIDGELLYGAFALQVGCLSPKQFLGAFEAWNTDRTASYKRILLDRNDILSETRTLLEKLFQQQITPSDFAELSSIDGGTLAFTGSPQPLNADDYFDLNDKASRNSSERYRYIRPLDQGGLGIVSVALDEDLNREVAIKEIRKDRYDNDYLLHKFLLEAQVTGGLEHPGIVPIYGIGRSADGRPYYAMRLIKGDNLRHHIKQFHESIAKGLLEFDGPQLRRLLQRFIDVCNAIEYAHARGILHRDIKPVNIMLGRYGETLVVDWGLAKAVGESLKVDSDYGISEVTTIEEEQPLTPSGSDASSETRLGSVLGTPAYASPEQLSGQVDRIGVASDVYGLGATLYELLTGHAPVSGNLLQIVQIVNAGKIPSPRSIQPAVSKSLQAICQKSMALNPADRYGSAQLLRQDIEHWLDDEPVTAYSESLLLRCRRWIRKHPTAASTVGVTALLSVLGSGAITTVVTQKNRSLAQLNAKLDAKNSELGEANNELAASNRREVAAREVAQEQSQLALSTLNAVVQDIQAGLKNVPRSSEIRRRLLATSLSRLDQVATKVAENASADRSTMIALRDIADLIVQFGDDGSVSSTKPMQGNVTSEEVRSTTRIALRALERAKEIAVSRYESAPKDPQAINDLFLLKQSLGNNYKRLGESDKGIATAKESLNLINQLVEQGSGDLRLLLLQSQALQNLAEILVQTGRNQEAKNQLTQELDILRGLKVSDKECSDCNSNLATALETLADVESRMDNHDQADSLLAESEAIYRSRTEGKEAGDSDTRSLAKLLWTRSNCKLKLGKIEDAEKLIAESSRLYQDASTLDPTDLNLQMFLSNVLVQEGEILARASKLDLAATKLQQALDIRQKQSENDPNDAMRARQVSSSKERIGALELRRGNPDRALEYLQASLAISEQLLRNDPNSDLKQRDVILGKERVARVYYDIGDRDKAIEIQLSSLTSHEQLSNANPDDVIRKRDWSKALSDLAFVYSVDGQLDQAQALYLKSLEIVEQLLANNSSNLTYLRDQGIVFESLSTNFIQKNELEKSLDYILKCIEVRKQILSSSSKDVRAKTELGGAYSNASSTLGRLGRFEESLTQGKLAIDLFEQALQVNASDLSVVEELALSQQRLAVTYSNLEDIESSLKSIRDAWKNYNTLVNRTKVPYAWLFNWAETGKLAYQIELLSDHEEEAKVIYFQLRKRVEELIEKKQSVQWAQQQLEILQTMAPEDPPQL